MKVLLAAIIVVTLEGACGGQGSPTPSPGPPGSLNRAHSVSSDHAQ